MSGAKSWLKNENVNSSAGPVVELDLKFEPLNFLTTPPATEITKLHKQRKLSLLPLKKAEGRPENTRTAPSIILTSQNQNKSEGAKQPNKQR